MRRLNYILGILLLISSFTAAQTFEEDDDYYEDDWEEVIFGPDEESAEEDFYYEELAEKGIYYEPLPPGERAETEYTQRSLDPNFKSNYSSREFDYDRESENLNFDVPDAFFQLSAGLIKILTYILLGILVVAIIYYIIKNAGGFSYGRDKRKIKVDASSEEDFEDVDNIENNNFKALIEKAKSQNDYRRAVRYYYLWVLQRLTEKKLIKWNKDKTDQDYFRELSENIVKDDFVNSSYIFDYIWYGEFKISQSEFKIAESIFKRALNKLN